jgi:hypothetical protein
MQIFFTSGLLDIKQDLFLNSFMLQNNLAVTKIEKQNDRELRMLDMMVEDCMFRSWALIIHRRGLLPIRFPTEVCINKNSSEVVYYTVSWILRTIFAAKELKPDSKDDCVNVAIYHTINREQAQCDGLPMVLLD